MKQRNAEKKRSKKRKPKERIPRGWKGILVKTSEGSFGAVRLNGVGWNGVVHVTGRKEKNKGGTADIFALHGDIRGIFCSVANTLVSNDLNYC